MTSWETYLQQRRTAHLDQLLDFLRIPSISALTDHAADVQSAAAWAADRLRAAGLEGVRILPTGGHPVVYAEHLHQPGKPTILIYGHFDVQPVDPVSLWSSPPFEPVVRDGRIYARGASDDKGNMLGPILAIEALLATEGALPVNVKFFLEGQEEIGSPQIPAFLAEQRDLFACDLVLSSDGGQFGEDQPSLFMGARGLAGVQIDVQGAKHDLHSGLYGGMVANPIHAVVRILDSLRDDQDRVLVPGFYDRVVGFSLEERAALASVPFDRDGLLSTLGVADLPGEAGYTPAERTSIRPTLEVNGIWGGFQGDGVKTVLPGEAHAKITCRLVANQDPEEIVELLIEHVNRQPARGVTVTARPLPGRAKPYLIGADHWGNVAAAAVLEDLYGRMPFQTRTGGSIPVCALFQEILGVSTVGFAFGLDDENFHAPDEFFRLRSFERSPVAYGKLLHALAERHAGAQNG
jgi:acetylornithine deacetylase/succinyl-diaminopimelate desuccinylase-like protein